MKQKLLIVLGTLFLICMTGLAKERTENEIKELARIVLLQQAAARSVTKSDNCNLEIVERLDGISIVASGKNGFAIITNHDDQIPVLGYSFSSYEKENVADGFLWWKNAVNHAVSQNAIKTYRAVPSQFKSAVTPLLKTTWNQHEPYNGKCPIKSGERCPTGCVATAMAQILYYYHYPLQGTGSHDGFDFANTIFEWGNMIHDYKLESSYSKSQGNAVATLMYACGKAADMKYDIGGSSASLSTATAALKKFFGYETPQYFSRNGYEGDWMSAIYNELSNSRVILYEGKPSPGSKNKDGHAFVLDGYDADGNVHVNWGWGGVSDGYYNIDILTPPTPDGNQDYSINQGMIISIRNYTAHPELTSTAINISGNRLPNTVHKATFTITNYGNDFNGRLYFFISQSETNSGSLKSQTNASIKSGSTSNITMEFTPNANGNYYLWLTADSEGKDIVGKIKLVTGEQVIEFKDKTAERVCVRCFDKNDDDALSMNEAASITSLTRIEGGELYDVTSFDELKYFTSLTSIPNYLFQYSPNLKSISFPSSLRSIEKESFIECTALESVTFDENAQVKTIPNAAFADCVMLKNVSFPNNLNSIGESAFAGCSALVKLNLPQNLNSIEEMAFLDCSSLKTIDLGGTQIIGQYTFGKCINLEKIIFSERLKKIEGRAFEGCENLEELVFPEGLTTIENDAFYNCNKVAKIVFPLSIKTIGYTAFRCSGLRDVYVKWTENPYEGDGEEFARMSSKWVLHIPKGTMNMYKSIEPWKSFTNIVEEESSSDDVTLTAKNYTRVYGDANPTFEYTVTGGTITSGTPTITCSATVTSPVGTYDIVIAKGTVSNSTVNLIKGTLTITKAPLTISAGNYTKKEGEDNPTFKATYSGFKNNETEAVLTKKPTITTTATKTSPTGSYPVTVSGAEAQNYAITYQNGTLTVTASGTPSPNAEPYAVLSNDNSVVTFFYDNNKVSRGGIDINNSWIGRSDSSPYGTAKKAVFDASFASYRPISTSYWFHKCSSMTTISGIENLKTDNVTDMGGMFAGCSSLTNLDVSGFKTDKVTIMYDLFSGCSSLTSLDVSGFNTSNVTSMRAMFYKLYALSSLDLSSFKTDKVEDMSFMFYWSSGIETIYVGSEWSTAAVKEGKSMFEDCRKLVGGQGTAYRNAYKDDYTYAHIDGGTANPGYLTDIKAKTEKVTLTAKSYSRIYGDPNPTFEYTVTGGTITSGAPTITCSATATSPVGTYDIVIAKGTVSNSNVELVKGTLTITKAPLTISAGNYTKVEGEDNPTFTPTYSGFKNGETEAVLTKKPIVTCEANKDSEPGSYEIKVSGAKAQNYDISYVSGWLTIEENPNKFEEDDTSYEILDDGTVAITKDWKVQHTQVLPTIVLYDGKSYTVTVIGADAFRNNQNLTQITIPNTITSIGDGAFAGCVNLTVIIIHVENPIDIAKARTRAGGSSVFEGVDKETCILYVPDGSVEAYKTTDGWNEFKNILPISALGIDGVYMNGKPFDIYTLQGRKVRHEATSLDGLPKGVYIINGRKVVK